MKIIDKKCEDHLQDILKLIQKEPTLWRCIYIEENPKATTIADKLRLELVTLIKDKHETFLFNLPEKEILFFSKGGDKKWLESISKKIQQVGKSVFVDIHPETIDLAFDFEKVKEREQYYLQRAARIKKGLSTPEKGTQKNKKPLHIEDAPQVIEQLKTTRKDHKKLTILLLDDDQITLKLVSNALKEYNVIALQDPQKALDEYFTIAPHIVFLDINIPPYSGHEILEKIVSQDKDAFVVMLSANAYPQNIKQVMQNGAKGFIGKPFSREKLLNYIETYNRHHHHKYL